MTKKRIAYLFIFTLLLFGCNDEIDYGLGEYRVDLVKIISGNTFSLLNNEETKLYSPFSLNGVTSGNRILLNYSQTGEQNDGYKIKINGIQFVASGTLENADYVAIGNSPIVFESAWIGLNYMNISFFGDHHSQTPYAKLLLESVIGSTYHISFRYDKRNDPPGVRTHYYTSFDLSPLLGPPGGGKTINVCFNASNYKPEYYTLTFEY